jgi:hypothetical protein
MPFAKAENGCNCGWSWGAGEKEKEKEATKEFNTEQWSR